MDRLPLIGKITRASTEYVKVPVETWDDAGDKVDPTDLVVQFAATPIDTTDDSTPNPDPGDWNAGEWSQANRTYFAKGLVGPDGGLDLAVGEWAVWVRVISVPERPARKVGRLVIES